MESNFFTPNKVIILSAPEEVIVERVTGRRLDPETGTIYHLKLNPPEGDDKEEVLARLTQRDDDTEEVLQKRLVTFEQNKDALVSAFQATSEVLVVDANRDPLPIWEDIKVFLSA